MEFGVSFWFQLKWNPQPCGYWGNSGEIAARQCRCTFRQIENYGQRISGPLLDRIDIYYEVPLVGCRELSSNTNIGEPSETIRQRVIAAREIQLERGAHRRTVRVLDGRKEHRHCLLKPRSSGLE